MESDDRKNALAALSNSEQGIEALKNGFRLIDDEQREAMMGCLGDVMAGYGTEVIRSRSASAKHNLMTMARLGMMSLASYRSLDMAPLWWVAIESVVMGNEDDENEPDPRETVDVIDQYYPPCFDDVPAGVEVIKESEVGDSEFAGMLEYTKEYVDGISDVHLRRIAAFAIIGLQLVKDALDKEQE